MSEGRRSQVVLLDERRLDILIQPRLYAGELLDMVASHFHLKEKEYFGLAFINDANQHSWLQMDKRVLEHELPKKAGSQGAVLILYFRVKYFVESISHLRDAATVEAFYLQAKSLLAKGDIEADSETVFELAALVVQATYGDHVDDLMFKTQLRRLPVLPASVLKEYPSISLCEEKVLQQYKEIIGQSRGEAIVNYLGIIEKLPTYGQHYYEIKDKTGTSCWLGLSYKGISQYEKNDRRNPQRVFLWKQLENLYYRDKKFTIEVHEARRVIHTLSSFNLYEDAIEEPIEDYDELSNAICDPTTQVSVSRRALAPANVTVYVWYASSPIVTKCIWSMAISQHHFFLDRKHLKSPSRSLPSLNQITSELCRSVQSLSSAGSLSNISRSNSSGSLPSTILGGEISEESKAAALEMLAALRTRKEALEEVLGKKTEELKALCLQEGELTGEIPPETPLQPGEAQPQVRRRVGTSFSLSDRFISKARNKDRETLNDLELQYEIQSQIASAAFQLMNACQSRKSVRKQRKSSYDQATLKLREIEHKLCTLRREKKKEKAEAIQNGIDEVDQSNDKDALDDSGVNLSGSTTESLISPQSVNESNLLKNTLCGSSVVPSSSLPQLTITECDSVTDQPCDMRQRHQSLQQLPYSNASCKSNRKSDESSTYDPCGSVGSSYCSRIDYDSASCGSGSGLPLRSPYRNRFEPRLDIDSTNLYSVPNRRASQVFDSQDDLLLSGKRNDFDCRSSTAKTQDGEPVYSNTLPISASYDERIWYGKAKDKAIIASSDGSSLETSFEVHSNNSCDATSLCRFESENRQPCSVGSPTSLPKKLHFRSESSLNCDNSSVITFHIDNLDTPTESDAPPLRPKRISHVRSVPQLHSEPPAKVVPEHSATRSNPINSVNQHSINQVVDLVQASMLLQSNKKTSSMTSLKYQSSKAKTKEWIETSLDSPIVPRKLKPKGQIDSPRNKFPDKTIKNYKTHIGLQNSPNQNSQNLQGELQTHPVKLVPFSKSTTRAEPSSRHYGRTEIEDHSPPYSNISPTMVDTSCDPVYYRTSYLSDDRLSNADSVSLRNNDYSTIEFDNASIDIVQENVNSTLGRYSTTEDDASLYNEYCDPDALLKTNTLQSSHMYHHTPTETPIIIPQMVTEHLVPAPQLPLETPNVNYITGISHVYSIPYANSNVEGTEQHSNVPSAQNMYESVEPPVQLRKPTPSTSSDCTTVLSEQLNDIPAMPYSHNEEANNPSLENNAVPEVSSMPPCSPGSFPFQTSNVEVNVVSVGHFQPYWEETKPYELSDFYKYSTKHRKHQPKQSADIETCTVPSDSMANNQTMDYWTDPNPKPAHYSVEVTKGFAAAPGYIPDQSQEILVNAHVAVVEHSDYETLQNNRIFEKGIGKKIVNSPPSNDDSYDNRLSLADTFHEEMLAWYENRDAVKKATLV